MDHADTAGAVGRRRMLQGATAAGAMAGLVAPASAAAKRHEDAEMFAAVAEFEAADSAFAAIEWEFGSYVPGTANHAAAEVLLERAREERAWPLLALCHVVPATMAGHVVRIRQALRIAARYYAPPVEPVSSVDPQLLAAVLRDLALLDVASGVPA